LNSKTRFSESTFTKVGTRSSLSKLRNWAVREDNLCWKATVQWEWGAPLSWKAHEGVITHTSRNPRRGGGGRARSTISSKQQQSIGVVTIEASQDPHPNSYGSTPSGHGQGMKKDVGKPDESKCYTGGGGGIEAGWPKWGPKT